MTYQGCLAICLLIAAGSASSKEDHVLVIDNRIDKFETFYGEATSRPMDSDARFSLWQKEGGLAAVPQARPATPWLADFLTRRGINTPR